MSSLVINIPDDIEQAVSLQAEEQGLSLQAYVEKLLRAKTFSSILNKLRDKTSNTLLQNNIRTNDDLINYLKQ